MAAKKSLKKGTHKAMREGEETTAAMPRHTEPERSMAAKKKV
jgi:hypothetical protein